MSDARKLTLPVREVVMVVVVGITAAASVWSANASLRSDVRDILTRMEAQRQLEDEKARLQDERLNQMRDAIQDMKRRQELQQYELQSFKEVITRLEARTK